MGKYITKICCVCFSCKLWIFSNRLSHTQKLGNRAQESGGNGCLSPLCSYQVSEEYLTLCPLCSDSVKSLKDVLDGSDLSSRCSNQDFASQD